MVDNSKTGAFRVTLPKDLLAAASKAPRPKSPPLQVEGWRTSWLSRLSEVLIGKD